jgi:hypothetical protein
MSDETLVQDELATLKARADMLGITYHPSIGLEKLRAKVAAAMGDEPVADDEASEDKPAAPAVTETAGQKRLRLRQDAERLVRVRITCMNPAKKEWDGEIITVGNNAVGTLRKFVPFNADEGWHIPHFMYEVLRDRECQVFTTVRDSRGNQVRKGRLIKEFAIEILDPLTPEELAELARRQAASHAID